MPVIAKELSEIAVRKLRHKVNADGIAVKALHAVGGVSGLVLQCMPPVEGKDVGSRQWILKTTVGDKRREFGLGGYPDIPLKSAREDARRFKGQIKQGIDPTVERKELREKLKAEQRSEISFQDMAEKYIDIQCKKTINTSKGRQKLRNQFKTYVFPYIGHMLIRDIQRHHLISMYDNYYYRIPHQAERIIGHVAKVFNRSIIEGVREKANPGVWKDNLDQEYPPAKKVKPTKHYKAVPWEKLPDFMRALREKIDEAPTAITALAIYTGNRPGVCRVAQWEDFDFDLKVWTIKEGSKANKSKRMWYIPLTDRTIALLKSQPTYKDGKGKGLVFKTVNGLEVPDAYLGSSIQEDLGFEGTTHGFRSALREWCQANAAIEEVAELTLQHTQNDRTRAAYARNQLFLKRKRLLTEYHEFLHTGKLDTNKLEEWRRSDG